MGDDRSAYQPFALPGARPHYGPDKLVAVEEIALDLVPDLERESLDGCCTTTVRAFDEPVTHLSLDAVDLDVSGVEHVEPGAPPRGAGFVVRDGKLDVTFDPPIAPGESATFAVTYRVERPRYGLFFVRPSASHPEKVAHAWTQSQDEFARYWFPCLDYPHEKQRSSTTITVPKGTFALSNGALVERAERDGKTVFRYRQDVPHSTYLMTMVAGPFVEVAQGNAGRNSVPVFYYVLPGRENDGERAFGKTPQMIACFEERTGMPYPYARYSQIAVSDFIFGGMENTSATTQTDRTLHDETAQLDFSSDPLVAHELAHQWFGDLLTCRDWSHAWLNEGFATFMEAVWREADLGYDEYLYDLFECLSIYLKEEAHRYVGRSSATRISRRSRFSTVTSTRRARPCCTCCAANSAIAASGVRWRATCARTRSVRSRPSTSFARSRTRRAATYGASLRNGFFARVIRRWRSATLGTGRATSRR